jgi:hypothetical protein
MTPSTTVQPGGLPVPRRYWAIAAIVLAISMSVLDSTIANIALPSIAIRVDGADVGLQPSIRDAQRILWRAIRVATEPGGAAAMAALLSGAYRPRSEERVGVVLCGGNTDAVSY